MCICFFYDLILNYFKTIRTILVLIMLLVYIYDFRIDEICFRILEHTKTN